MERYQKNENTSETHNLKKEEVLSFETDESREIRRQFHIRKLQEPHIKAFFKLLRRTPHLYDQLLARTERRKDFSNMAHGLDAADDVSNEIGDNERIRLLAPLWSAACTVNESRTYLELMLDEASQSESERVKEKLREKQQYVRELIIGAGMHGAVYNAEFIHNAPQVSRLTVDAANRLGGQFRRYGGPALSMNTQNRPVNTDQLNTLDNPNQNSLGPHAPLQLPDISGNLYADNEKIGLVAGINQYLSSDTALGLLVRHVGLNKDPENTPGKYCVELKDVETGECHTVMTDKVITSMGLGNPEYGFAQMDEETEKICFAEDSQVMTYADFLEVVGDRTNPFPMEKFIGKRVVIIGGGHSGLTVAESLVGLGPEYRGSVASLGSPAEITILGTKFDDEKGLLSKEIPRYAQLASIMRKSEIQGESHQQIIKPIQGLRALRLEEAKGALDGSDSRKSIIIHCQKKTADESDSVQEQIEADVIIVTTGFSNTYKEIFRDLLAEKETSEQEKGSNFSDHMNDVITQESPHPVARHLEGHSDILFIGPAANMPLNEREREASQRFNRPSNPVALPNTVDDTRLCAKFLAEQELHKIGTNTDVFMITKPERTILPDFYPPILDIKPENTTIDFTISPKVASKKFPPEVRYEDLLNLAQWQHEARYQSPSGSEVSLSLTHAQKGNTYTAELDALLPEEYQMFLDTFLRNPLAQSAIAKLTEKRHSASKKIDIALSPSKVQSR